jgi:hypothetical protein
MTLARKPGNPLWGKAIVPMPSGPTSFEEAVKKLKLHPEDYVSSPRLKEWVRENKDHKYVPSELLEAWGFEAKVQL